MDNLILKEIIELNKEKKSFCTVSKIDDSHVDIIISDKNDKSDMQKFAQEALSSDQLIIVNYKNKCQFQQYLH